MTNKLFHLVKMSWMFFWRLYIVSIVISAGRLNDAVLPIAVILAAVMIFGLNKAIRTWPIARMVFRGQWLVPADYWERSTPESREARNRRNKETRERSEAQAASIAKNARRPESERPVYAEHVYTATSNGKLTGFEPRNLASISVPTGPFMHGKPGGSINEEIKNDPDSVGAIGDENFAKALQKTHLLNRFFTVWSKPTPDLRTGFGNAYGWTTDCVLATESTLYVIDLKFYKSGNVRYHTFNDLLYCEDIPTGKEVGGAKYMTQGVKKAAEAVKRHHPEANVVPIVVFMPTDKGEAVLDNVYWPGGVPAVNLTDFLKALENQTDFDRSYTNPQAKAALRLSTLTATKRDDDEY